MNDSNNCFAPDLTNWGTNDDNCLQAASFAQSATQQCDASFPADTASNRKINSNSIINRELALVSPVAPVPVAITSPVSTGYHAIVPGFAPDAGQDLVFYGGRTIAHLQYENLYVGGAQAWTTADRSAIDQSLAAAMSDPVLNSVLAQYFPGQVVTSQFLGSQFVSPGIPAEVTRVNLENYITSLDREGFFQSSDLQSTVFNFILPEGTVLSDKDADSLNGLGGFHSSVHAQNAAGQMNTIYYSVDVYSKDYRAVTNGIVVFDQPWKSVVGTLYHELQEARTDPDVGDVIAVADQVRTYNQCILSYI